jgi:nucleotide-binding universal stress UspA family protein
MGVLSQNLFTMIVAMALITTLTMPPTLRWALQRLPMRKEERERLEREEFEEKAFVSNLERLLVVIDKSANGQFALRVAGLLAGSRRMTVTILNVAAAREKEKEKAATEGAADALRKVAEGATTLQDVEKVDVIVREHDLPPADAVAEEARRGYDLLILGVHPVAATRGGFSAEVSKLASAFEGSIAIVNTRGDHAKAPLDAPLSVLVPVTGNETSRRGAEVALTLAHAAESSLTALSVIGTDTRNRRQRRRESESVLEEIGKIAKHYNLEIKTAVRADASAENAIKQAAKRGKANLIAMGVSRRPGDELAFGEVASGLLKNADTSVIFIAPWAQGAVKSSSKGPEKAAAEN